MSTTEIVSSILNLPFKDRIKLIELILKTIQQHDEERLEKAALLMVKDYKEDPELTDLTELDMEHFYETR